METISDFQDYSIKFSDDVTPCITTFTAKGDWNWTRWLIDDSIYASEIESNSGVVNVWAADEVQIDFEGVSGNSKYVGSKRICLPPIAGAILIAGFSFAETNTNIDLVNKEITISYYNSVKHFEKTSLLKVDEESDTVLLEQPILFSIDGFYLEETNNNQYIDIDIKTPHTLPIRDSDIYGSFYLRQSYLGERFYNNGKVSVTNTRGNSTTSKIYLVVDWLP